MRPPGRYAVAAALAVGLASGLLTACSGGGKAAAKAQLPPAQRLAEARAALEKSPAVSFTLTSEGLPGKAVGGSAG